MMNLRKHLHSAILGWGLAVFLTGAQSASAQANSNPQNPDLTRQQIATFDQFLDQHPAIDRQLQQNPSLINNADFIEDHPELRDFLASHKEVSEELKEDPGNFMHREQRFDNAESRRRNPNPDLTRQQIATFDQFLDNHPAIDRQLQQNPSLINNAEFIEGHPELREFLTSHKEVSEELKENPADFMRREQRFDNAESRRRNPNPDLTRQQIATFDQFLDKHPDLDKQLEANPGLVNDRKFIDHHHELRAFLKDHPEVREELQENASQFMRREQRFDMAEHNAGGARFDARNPDLTRKEVATFDNFLDHHKSIDKDLRKNPSLVNDEKFLKSHHELRSFLEKNPGVSEELRENPSDFMRQESRFERGDLDRHADRADQRKSGQADKDKNDKARNDRDDKARRDRDKNARAERDRRDRDKAKIADKDDKSALEQRERLQTTNPH